MAGHFSTGGGEKGFEMRLQMQGVIGTGNAVLDQGITDLEVAVIDGVVHLYSSTGRNGGLASYTVGADGEVTMDTSVIFPPNITGTVSDKIVLTDVGGEMVILYGETGAGLRGYSLDGGVLGTDMSIAWNPLVRASIGGNFTATEAMIELSVEHFMAWWRALELHNPIASVRRGAEANRDEILAKARTLLERGRSPEEALEFLAHTLTNKLLHAPSANLRAAALRGDAELLQAAEKLFDAPAVFPRQPADPKPD